MVANRRTSLKFDKRISECNFFNRYLSCIVAEKAVEKGVAMVNDVSGGNFDKNMFSTVARLKVPYVLMHMQGRPETMQIEPHYEDVIQEILNFFTDKIQQLREFGIHDLIIDPGFGFGKNRITIIKF